MMMTDLEERTGTGSAAASSSKSDTPLVVQVLYDAHVMLNQAFAFERQPEEQKAQPQPEQLHDAVATVTTSHEQGPLPPSPLAVTPTVLLKSEVDEWARLLMHREEQPLPITATADTNTRHRKNQATVDLLYQDFTTLCNSN
jgi:hypothetical protein